MTDQLGERRDRCLEIAEHLIDLVAALGLPSVTLLGTPDPRLPEALTRAWGIEVSCAS